MTLAEISRRLGLSPRTRRAELLDAGVSERTFRHWLAHGLPLFAQRAALRKAAQVAAPGEVPIVRDGGITFLRDEDFDALTAAPVSPHAGLTPSRLRLIAEHEGHAFRNQTSSAK